MDDAANYITLRDYLATLRTYRWYVLVPTLVLAIAVAAVSLGQEKQYEAQARLLFQDQNEALSLLGSPGSTTLTPAQRATQAADTLLSPRLMAEVQRRTGSAQSVEQLTDAVTAVPTAATSLVEITAQASDPQFAATLANSVAEIAAEQQTTTVRDGYQQAADRLKEQLSTLKNSEDPATNAVYASRISQLLGLAAVARPVDVAALGRTPDSPVSPKPLRNTVVAGVLGFFIGLMLVMVRKALDRRLRTMADIEREIDDPVLGHVRQTAMGYAGTLTVSRDALDPVDAESFKLLRNNLEFLDPRGGPECVAVTSGLPEEGKSTVAASVAAAAAATDRRVLLVECDLRRPSLSARLGVSPTVGLSTYLSDPEVKINDIVNSLDFETGSSQFGSHTLNCIVAGRITAETGERLTSSRFRQFVTEAREHYDLIVFDTAPVLSVADTMEVLRVADAVLLCIRSGRTTRDQARSARNMVHRVPGALVGLVVTGMQPREAEQYGYYPYAYQGDPQP